MSRVGSFRELRVYRQAFRQAMVVKALLASFPAEERFDLVSQLRRSSRSVCANLAEAWRRRSYPKAFVAKVIDAEAEASETRVHLEIAAACGYLTDAQFNDLDSAYDQVIAQLVVMRTHPEDWRPGAGSGRARQRRQTPSRDASPKPRAARPEDRSGSTIDKAPSSPAAAHTKTRSTRPTAEVLSAPAGARSDRESVSPGDDSPSIPPGSGSQSRSTGPANHAPSSRTDARKTGQGASPVPESPDQ